jgi:hypothetical protein
MGIFTKAAGQTIKGMASVFIGILVVVSIKALIRMIKGMVST